MSYPAKRQPLPSQQASRSSANKPERRKGSSSSKRNPPSAIPSAQKQQTLDLSHKPDTPFLVSLPPEWSGEENLQIRKLDLSGQEKLGPALHGIRFIGESLTWLNLSGVDCKFDNGKETVQWSFFKMCRTLFVLNLSHCHLSSIPKELASVTSLKALVLSHNQITSPSLSVLSTLTSLNSLILSNNSLTSFPSSLTTSLVQLKKFSLANNNLSSDGLPDFAGLEALEEFRLNGNPGIATVPDGLDNCAKLAMLELSTTGIKSWEEVEKLSGCKALVNLGIKGTAFAEAEGGDTDAYNGKIVSLLPNLRIIDNRRFDPKYLQRKEKEKARQEGIPTVGPIGMEKQSKGKIQAAGKPKSSKVEAGKKKEQISDVRKGKRKAESQGESLPVEQTGKVSKKRKANGQPGNTDKEQEVEPVVYEDNRAASLTSLPRDPSEPKKKRSRYRKRLEKAAALAAGLPYDSSSSKPEKKAKSVGGSLGGGEVVTKKNQKDAEAGETEGEGPKTLDELLKTRSNVVGVIDVQRQDSKIETKGRGRKEGSTRTESKPTASDVFSLLFSKETEQASKPTSGWD